MNVVFFCSENIALQTLNSAEMSATQPESVMPSSRSAAATVGNVAIGLDDDIGAQPDRAGRQFDVERILVSGGE